MANIQYADDGIYTVNFYAEDDCGNRATGTRTINVRERQFTISFDSKGGSVVSAILVNEGDDATNFQSPTKEGVAFKGWYDNPYCYGDPVTIIEDVQQDYTLYAKWGDESYFAAFFTDKTLALQIPESQRQNYVNTHGAILNEYPGLDDEHDYVFATSVDRYWYGRRAEVETVIIASPMKPTSLDYWFKEIGRCTVFDGESNINTTRCTSMKQTFMGFNFNVLTGLVLDLSTWNVSNVTNFRQTFMQAWLAGADVSTWNTSSATDMYYMFSEFHNTTGDKSLDLSSFDFSDVTTLEGMFSQTSLTRLALGNPDTSSCTKFVDMFYGTQLRTIISDDFDTSSQANTNEYLFQSSSAVVGGNGTTYDSSKIGSTMAVVDKAGRDGYFTMPTTVRIKVYSSPAIMDEVIVPTGVEFTPTWREQPSSIFKGWHFNSSLTDPAFTSFIPANSCSIYAEYADARTLTYHFNNGDPDVTESVEVGTTVRLSWTPSMPGYQFVGWYDNSSLVGEPIESVTVGTSNIDVYAKYEEIISDMHVYFYNSDTQQGTLILSVPNDESIIDQLKQTYGSYTKKYYNKQSGIMDWRSDGIASQAHHVRSYGAKSVLSPMYNVFGSFNSLIDCDLSALTYSSRFTDDAQTNMTFAFQGCRAMTSVTFPSQAHYSSTPINWRCTEMFESCSSLTATSPMPCADISSADAMYRDCTKLQVAQFGQPFERAGTMRGMFDNCEKLQTVSFPSSFNTAVLQDTRRMFAGCTELTTIDNIDKLTYGATWLVISLEDMFFNCSSLTSLDLSGWTLDPSILVNFTNVFYGCSSLTTIKVPSTFDLSPTSKTVDNWCFNCTSLRGGQGTTYNSSMSSSRSHARVDGGTSAPGLFTQA